MAQDITNEGLASARDVLELARKKGINLWMDGNRLRYTAPKGTTALDLERIRSLKQEIIALLKDSVQHVATHIPLAPRLRTDAVPITFTQRFAFRLLMLDRRPSSLGRWPVRVIGALHLDSLQQAFCELVRRHELLRTKIIWVNGIPRQVVGEPDCSILQLVELSGSSKSDREMVAQRFLAEHLRKVDVSVGPSFAATLLKLDDQDHVLAIFWEHQISDMASVGILWREIWTAYTQSVRGLPFSFPNIAIQAADYAVWEQKTNQVWLQEHGDYWRQCLARAPSIRLFADEEAAKAENRKWTNCTTHIDDVLTQDLRGWARGEHTTLMMALLTAFVAAVARWSGRTDIIVWVANRGRFHPSVETTVGGFACLLPLRIKMHENDTLNDLSRRVVAEYGHAQQHADFFRTDPIWNELLTLLKNPGFNWLPNSYGADPTAYFNDLDDEKYDQTIRLQLFPLKIDLPVEEPDPWEELGFWPLFFEGKRDVRISGQYRADHITQGTVDRFGKCLLSFSEALVETPAARIKDLECL